MRNKHISACARLAGSSAVALYRVHMLYAVWRFQIKWDFLVKLNQDLED